MGVEGRFMKVKTILLVVVEAESGLTAAVSLFDVDSAAVKSVSATSKLLAPI